MKKLCGGIRLLTLSLCLLLVLVAAVSWIKSYWRADWLAIAEVRDPSKMAAPPNWRPAAIADSRGQFVLVRFPDFMGQILLATPGSWRFGNDIYVKQESAPSSASVIFSPNAQLWRYGGFFYESDQVVGVDTLAIPHWFLLLTGLAASWWLSGPWRKRGAMRRGFDVLPAAPTTQDARPQ